MWAHRKGQSKDEWIRTIAKMMEDFCLGVGVKLKLFHTGRRTTVGERVADALSKGCGQRYPQGASYSWLKSFATGASTTGSSE